MQIRDAGAIAGIIKNSIDVLSIPVNWYDNLLSCKSPKEFCKYYLFKPTFEYIDMLVRKGPLKTWATLTYAVKVFFKISVIDFRYSFIRSNGIFESLDKKGYLNHKVVSEKEISKRMKTPQPDSIRAMFRASMIKLYHDSQDAICGWEKFSVGENTYKMPTPDCSFPNFKKTKFKKIIKKIYLFLNCLKVLFFK
ncbi:MAG: hypothetical protein D6734_09500 [Candidatus Schekmanbacteria bacterium]|nr:MAG: hypothetical protein D6734_09500 [Candidatus Schekmanbacteria bacterium]